MDKEKRKEYITYFVFGVGTTLVDWITYTILWKLGVDYKISTVVSWIAAVLFAYITNRRFVFKSDSSGRNMAKEFASFVLCRSGSGVVSFLLMMLFVDVLHIHELIGKVFVSGGVLVLNYILSKLIIFRKKK